MTHCRDIKYRSQLEHSCLLTKTSVSLLLEYLQRRIYGTRFKRKKVLVTGSTKGIGYKTAELFAKEGAEVFINGRSKESTTEALQELQKIGLKAQAVIADVATEEGLHKIINEISDVDILVNNAGYFEPRPFFEIRRDDWMKMYSTNVLSGAQLTQFYLPKMLKKNHGRVLFISSESALNVPVEMIHYGMSKTAQLTISRGSAELCRGTNVTVNSVLPGPTFSEGVEDFVKNLAQQNNKSVDQAGSDFIREHRPTSINQRFATPEEIANVVVFLSSDKAAMINGTAVRVDGGVFKSIS